MNKKQKIANVLYWLAIAFSVLNFLAILIIGWEFIFSGKGVGSFAVLWAGVYATISTIIWFVAFLLDSERTKLTIAYWATIAAPVLLFTLLPVKFYIE
ncbi:MAG: hypothetical protein Q9M92_08915 [Enterobacterales bacterium]|nr:hypothetical protein [Enterobacterales bacterium]